MDLQHPGLTTVTASGVPSRLGSLDTGGTTSMANGQGTAEVGVVSDILSNSGVSSNASALLGLTTLFSRSQGLRVLSRSAPAATATGSSGSDLLMSFGNNLTRGSTQSNGHAAATVNANASQTGGSFDVRQGATTRDLPLTAPARGIIRADSPYHRTVAGGASGTQQPLSGGHQNVEPVNEGPLHEGDSTENGDERPPNPSPNLSGTNPYGATIPGMLFTLTNRNNEAFWWEHRLYAREGRGTRVGVRYRCRGPGHCTSSCTLAADRSHWVRRPSPHVPGCLPDPHRQEVSLAARRLQVAALNDENLAVVGALTVTGNNEYADARDVRNLRERQSYTMRSSLQVPGLPTGPIGSQQFRRQTYENIARHGLQTTNGDTFLRFNDVDEGIAVFAATECIRKWADVDMFFIDCTFFVTPPGFAQTMTVTGCIGTQFIQLAYVLLPDKLERTYRMALRELRRAVEQVNGACSVAQVMTDFENGLRNAITSVFMVEPQNLRACLFHASKAWFRRIQSEGLAPVYREQVNNGEAHSQLNRWLHAVFGLPCLHPTEVEQVWGELKRIQPQDQRVTSFVNYLDQYFMLPTSTWPPVYWAALAGERHRTNNAAESLHSVLKRLIGRRHPNVRLFLQKLKVHHESVRIKLRSTRIPSSRRSPKELQRCVIVDQYTEGRIQLFELLEDLGRVNTFPNLSADGDRDEDGQS